MVGPQQESTLSRNHATLAALAVQQRTTTHAIPQTPQISCSNGSRHSSSASRLSCSHVCALPFPCPVFREERLPVPRQRPGSHHFDGLPAPPDPRHVQGPGMRCRWYRFRRGMEAGELKQPRVMLKYVLYVSRMGYEEGVDKCFAGPLAPFVCRKPLLKHPSSTQTRRSSCFFFTAGHSFARRYFH